MQLGSEVALVARSPRLEVLRRTIEGNLPIEEDHHATTHLEHILSTMICDNQGHSRPDPGEPIAKYSASCRIQTGKGLVQQQEPRS